MFHLPHRLRCLNKAERTALSFCICAAALVSIGAAHPRAVSAYTLITDTLISTSTTWNPGGSPYIVAQQTSVAPDATLTIEPGTVVKFAKLGSISVHGTLDAVGTSTAPIIFTSVRDGDWGGDTDGFDYLRPPVTASSTVLLRGDVNGLSSFRLSDGSPIIRYVWVTPSGAGNGYLDQPMFTMNEPAVAYSSPIEFIASGPDVGGSCPFSFDMYTGVFESDLGCETSYAKAHNIPIVEYASPLSAAAGDYTFALEFREGSHGHISNAVFRYGGGKQCQPGCGDHSMIELSGGDVNIRDTSVSDGFAGVWLRAEGGTANLAGVAFSDLNDAIRAENGVVTVVSSVFDRVVYGINNLSQSIVTAASDWWGGAFGPRTDPNQSSTTAAVAYQGVSYVPWLSVLPPAGATSSAFWQDPNIGATSTATSTAPQQNGSNPPPERPVLIIPGILGSLPAGGGWVLDPVFHTYDSLMGAFLANGYAASSTFFTLPYDWRKSNVETAALIRQKLAQIRAVCDCAKVDIVAHSMGALAARSYVESSQYAGDVARMVFVAAPHKGSPVDYLMWEGGRVGSSAHDFLMNIIFTVFAKTQGYKDVFDYVRHYPVDSIRELLPVYDYLKESATSTPKPYPTDYPTNTFLRDLNLDLPALLATSSSVLVYNIAGDTGSSTVSSIIVGPRRDTTLWRYGEPLQSEYGTGDGTVPLSSATLGDGFDTILSAGHSDLPTTARNIIVRMLTGFEPAASPVATSTTNILTAVTSSSGGISRSLLLISPSGRKVGRSKASATPVNEIPGAYYSGDQGGSEIIVVPDPEQGNYTVETSGSGGSDTAATSSGYEVDVQLSSESTSTIESFVATSSESGTGTSSATDLAFDVSGSDVSPIATIGNDTGGLAQGTAGASIGESGSPVPVSTFSGSGHRTSGSAASAAISAVGTVVAAPQTLADRLIMLDIPVDAFVRAYQNFMAPEQRPNRSTGQPRQAISAAVPAPVAAAAVPALPASSTAEMAATAAAPRGFIDAVARALWGLFETIIGR